MNTKEESFLKVSSIISFDLEHRKRMNFALKQADDAYKVGRRQFKDITTAKKISKNIKWNAVEHLGAYLLEFESKFNQNGGKVIWAENSEQALEEILKICINKNAKTVVKSKSIVTEEIHLNQFLTKHNIETLETDLGEYIQQLDEQSPYHIVSPSLHKSKEDVADLFHRKLKVSPGLSPEELTLVARNKLREKYKTADIGITGINFILPDIGGIAITENEGNAWLSASFPKIHIAITGIEKVLPTANELGLFWPLLATHGSGQRLTVYNSIYTGPKKKEEVNGPEEMYVILLDNRRTTILADRITRESLYCIRCGACLNVCPVYKNIGGHAYGTTYSGPIGAVITPYLQNEKEFKHLSFASSICGACTEVCPVNINLHSLLLDNRRKSIENGYVSTREKVGWAFWKYLVKNRAFLDWPKGKFRNIVFRIFFRRFWGQKRRLPSFGNKTFSLLKKTDNLNGRAKKN